MEYSNKKNKNNLQGGFTLLEIIAVLIILSIIAAVAISKITSTNSYNILSEADILKMHLRHAQLRALSDDKTWGISFAGNSYTLLRDGNTSPYNLPNENSPTHTKNSVQFSGNTVTFDEWGSPGTNPITINISSGGETKVITIMQNTGFIP